MGEATLGYRFYYIFTWLSGLNTVTFLLLLIKPEADRVNYMLSCDLHMHELWWVMEEEF